MADNKKSEAGTRSQQYAPYGLPYGGPWVSPWARGYGWHFVPRPTPLFPYGAPLGAAYQPFGVPYTSEMMRKYQLEAFRAQAKYFEDALKEIKQTIAELEEETEKSE